MGLGSSWHLMEIYGEWDLMCMAQLFKSSQAHRDTKQLNTTRSGSYIFE